jgi:hypothetical protein
MGGFKNGFKSNYEGVLKMTISEIKAVLSPVTVWMAQEAVMEGVKAHHKAQKQYDIENQKKESGETYNFTLAHAYNEGVHVAAEILWKLFASCSAECQQAIAEVAKNRDGFSGYAENYLDDFINALEKAKGYSVQIRVTE